jgi:hypothetical protein
MALEFKPLIQLVTKTADREIEFRFGSELDLASSVAPLGGRGGDDCPPEGVDLTPSTGEGMDLEDDLMGLPSGGAGSGGVAEPILVLSDIKAEGWLKDASSGGGAKKIPSWRKVPHPDIASATTELQPLWPSPEEVLDEASVHQSFTDWLAGVTERINLCMHYQFDGKPDTLVFHVAHKLFDCLQQRLSAGTRKKRLPNWVTHVDRRDTPPLGTFAMSTWHITNVLHLKHIFDTPQMQLEVTRSFVQNRDGSYEHVAVGSQSGSADVSSVHQSNNRPIRPSQLRTFLKVGNMSPDQTTPTPFIIEWIADLLPISHVGELRITLEYGHQRNGQRVERSGLA